MLAQAPNSRPSPPLPALPLSDVSLGPVVMADDPCEAAFSHADPTGPRKYYRARYYDPKVGRFISEDPVGYVEGPNLYSYVDNDPINWIDPSGEAKGGKQNISVTHGGKTLTKSTPLSEIEACLKEAIEKAMSPQHIKKLRGLAKVVKRGGAMALASPYIVDTTIAEIDRAKRCGGLSCVQEQYCKDLEEEGNPDFVLSPVGVVPNPCKCGGPFGRPCIY